MVPAKYQQKSKNHRIFTFGNTLHSERHWELGRFRLYIKWALGFVKPVVAWGLYQSYICSCSPLSSSYVVYTAVVHMLSMLCCMDEPATSNGAMVKDPW